MKQEQRTPDRSSRTKYSFIQRGNNSIKSARNQKNSNSFNELPLVLNEQQRTQILLTLCIEMTLCLPGRHANEDELQEQAYKEILGLLQVLQWRINALKQDNNGTRNDQTEIQISSKEFDKLYDEWLARKGIAYEQDKRFTNMQCMLQLNKSLCLNDIKVQVSTILTKLGITEPSDWILMTDLLSQQVNR